MSTLILPFKLTAAGIDASFNLGAIALNVTHVQTGSGNRLANGNEVALVTPQETAVISSYFEVSAGQHRIAAIVAGSASVYLISEIGLWSGVPGAVGSVLVFYRSLATGHIAVKSANIDFNFEDDIAFGGVVPGDITIVADTQFNALAMLAAHEANPNAHTSVTTQPLWDSDTSPASTEFVQQTVGGLLIKSIAGAVNVTLTDIEAGHGIIKLTGAITANINVIVPVSHTFRWLIDNETTGGFSVTVKTAAGTGVVCAKNNTVIAWTDGFNVYQVHYYYYLSAILLQSIATNGAIGTSLVFDSAGNLYWAIPNFLNGTTYNLNSMLLLSSRQTVEL